MPQNNGLDSLIKRLARLPGLGPRSAQRAALFLLKNRDQLALPLAAELDQVARSFRACAECGNLDQQDLCHICTDGRRQQDRLCVVEDVSDLWAIERAGIYAGQYHILGGSLSALDGRGPRELGIDRLVARARQMAESQAAAEVILATSATLDGQTTAHYIAERLAGLALNVTRLAHGLPVGGELNYLDEGTLAQALKARSRLPDF